MLIRRSISIYFARQEKFSAPHLAHLIHQSRSQPGIKEFVWHQRDSRQPFTLRSRSCKNAKCARVCEVAIAFLHGNLLLHPRNEGASSMRRSIPKLAIILILTAANSAPSRAEEKMVVDMGKLTCGELNKLGISGLCRRDDVAERLL